ncbi:MAG TPA: alpha/beta fold hydrolase [Bryobacteraceae bacterium]|jgi:esterase/lipase superfamily enzyme
MNENLQQLALITALLTNWDGILLRMGTLTAADAKRLAALGDALDAVRNEDDLARVIDDLLDFTADTAADAYTRELISRFTLPSAPKVRGIVRGIEPLDLEILDQSELSMRAGQDLGKIIATETDGVLSVPLFFGTNRKPAEGGAGFEGELVNDVSFGLAYVTIPVNKHRHGKIEKPHWWTLYKDSDAEHKFIQLTRVQTFPQSEFSSKLENAVTAAKTPEVLVFLHGFNVTFEEAALRAAQISYDMNFRGVILLFSWPSLGSWRPSASAIFPYTADEARADASGKRLADFLRALEGGPFHRVHLMAHSMGSRVLLSGIADNLHKPGLPLGHVAFVAADIYVASFESNWTKFQSAGAASVTSYASNADHALKFSNWWHVANRVGLISDGVPYVTDGLQTIDASAVSTSLLGHSDFGMKRSLLTDIGLLLDGLSPDGRKLKPVTAEKKSYWKFPA